MKYQIQSDNLQVTLDSNGAGITSIIRDGAEYLWQADPEYWSGQAPVMFPICGCLRGGEADLLNGKKVRLDRHGFARRRDFIVKEQKADEVTYELVSDEETMKAYPFPFIFQMNYKVVDNCLSINHIVTNTGDETMPYFILYFIFTFSFLIQILFSCNFIPMFIKLCNLYVIISS